MLNLTISATSHFSDPNNTLQEWLGFEQDRIVTVPWETGQSWQDTDEIYANNPDANQENTGGISFSTLAKGTVNLFKHTLFGGLSGGYGIAMGALSTSNDLLLILGFGVLLLTVSLYIWLMFKLYFILRSGVQS